VVSRDAILDVLRTINDPEMPLSIVDLGIVADVRAEGGPAGHVEIDLLPTFVGCPALPVLEDEIRRRVGRLEGVTGVRVNFRYDPPWTVDRISAAGRESLRRHGVTVPGEAAAPHCPFCGASSVHLESSFGPTRCRMIYYCEACRNPFEHMKRVEPAAGLIDLSRERLHPAGE
jgi:ring-1,2-phenylacetyl-CoA epoxidase subunit PaaD